MYEMSYIYYIVYITSYIISLPTLNTPSPPFLTSKSHTKDPPSYLKVTHKGPLSRVHPHVRLEPTLLVVHLATVRPLTPQLGHVPTVVTHVER